MAIISSYHRMVPSPEAMKGIEWSLDARRAIVFFRRAAGGVLIGAGAPNVNTHSIADPYREGLAVRRETPVLGEGSPNTTDHSGFVANKSNVSLSDYVAIIDLDSAGEDKDYEVIRLPFIPKELEYTPESAFAAIRPIGRNNPIYHFTGSEDTLEFEIDWYAFDSGRREVIENCRKIEALSKADAYNHGPHRVKLLWGKQNILFSDHEFIILGAPYKLSHFNKGYIDTEGVVQETHLLPIQAYQKVTLGRITRANLSKVDIEFVNYNPKARKAQITTVR